MLSRFFALALITFGAVANVHAQGHPIPPGYYYIETGLRFPKYASHDGGVVLNADETPNPGPPQTWSVSIEGAGYTLQNVGSGNWAYSGEAGNNQLVRMATQARSIWIITKLDRGDYTIALNKSAFKWGVVNDVVVLSDIAPNWKFIPVIKDE